MDSAGGCLFHFIAIPVAGIDNQTMTFTIVMNSPPLAGHSIA